MKTYYESTTIYDCVYRNGLRSIDPILKGEKANILEFYEPTSIYGCLDWFSDKEVQPDFIFVNNKDWRSHIILLRYKVSLLYIGYDYAGWFNLILPFSWNKGGGNNHQLFNHRYMLFVRKEALENLPPKPKMAPWKRGEDWE